MPTRKRVARFLGFGYNSVPPLGSEEVEMTGTEGVEPGREVGFPVYARGKPGALSCGNCGAAAPADVASEPVYSSGGREVPPDLVGVVPEPSQRHVGTNYSFDCPECGSLNVFSNQHRFID